MRSPFRQRPELPPRRKTLGVFGAVRIPSPFLNKWKPPAGKAKEWPKSKCTICKRGALVFIGWGDPYGAKVGVARCQRCQRYFSVDKDHAAILETGDAGRW